jgi:hypothetical protein
MINLLYSLLPVIFFIAGFCFGFNIRKKDELPKIKTPVEVIEEHKEKVKIKEEASKLNAYLENIDNYPHNQKTIKE